LDRPVQHLSARLTVKATGKTASMYMQHRWRFAGGKIVFFRGSEDTAQSAEAFR